MQQVYRYYITDPMLNTQVRFFLDAMGRFSQIIWYDDEKPSRERRYVLKNKPKEELEAIKDDLTSAFKKLALGNPQDFRTLYYILNENDPVAFSFIQEALEQTQQLFNFK